MQIFECDNNDLLYLKVFFGRLKVELNCSLLNAQSPGLTNDTLKPLTVMMEQPSLPLCFQCFRSTLALDVTLVCVYALGRRVSEKN